MKLRPSLLLPLARARKARARRAQRAVAERKAAGLEGGGVAVAVAPGDAGGGFAGPTPTEREAERLVLEKQMSREERIGDGLKLMVQRCENLALKARARARAETSGPSAGD